MRGARSERALQDAPWQGPAENEPYFLDFAGIPESIKRQRYLQVKVLLKATIDAAFETTPSVSSVYVEQKETE